MAIIFGIQAFNSLICGYFCIGFIDFLIESKSVLDYAIYFLLANIKRMTK